MKITDERILVTGAAGFIGSNITERLVKDGCHVIGIDNLSTGRLENLAGVMGEGGFEFHNIDIRDLDAVVSLTRDVGVIFHEAAFVSVPLSVDDPLSCNRINVEGSLNMLEAARRNDVGKIVLASSAAVYGDDPSLPKVEAMPVQSISPYATSKIAAEFYFSAYHAVHGMNTSILRYFNVFGPRQDTSAYSGVISIILSRALNALPPVVYGDGAQTRDFVYVKDVVEANILSAVVDRSNGEIFNVGCGVSTSVLDLVHAILDVTGRGDLEIQFNPARPGDIVDSLADISKASRLLGYSPSYSLSSGLSDYVQYERGRNLE
ncbi:MAG: SDR family NAD(P)-dependent oxidoreductase [Promethearchaeota archaeon]